MNLLVTGTTGFIGGHLVRRLAASHEVTALVRPGTVIPGLRTVEVPTDTDELTRILIDRKIDGVIHLATHFLATHTSEDIPALIDANVTFGTRMLEAATKAGVPWFINTGTFTQYRDETTYGPANLYSATKLAFHHIAQYYASATDLTVCTLELFNTFGPNDPRRKLFTLWKTAMDTGTPLDMSPGEQIMDISYVDNVVDGFVRAIALLGSDARLEHDGAVYTLPSPERMTLRELAHLFETTLGTELPVRFGALPYRPNEVMVPRHGTPLPGWQPSVSLAEGIRRTFTSS